MSLRLTPYVVMNGNAEEAIRFYEQVLGAKALFVQRFGETPENPDSPLPEDVKERVSFATLQVGESVLMFSDTLPGQPHQSGNQVTLCVSTNDKETSQQLYERLQQGGQVQMPLQETFFSPAYAIVTDKFGITIQIFTEGREH